LSPLGQARRASPEPPSHRASLIRRERRPPDQILAAERAAEAFTEGLTHVVRREVIRDLRPRAITRRGRSAGQIDVMTADIPARGIAKERRPAIGVADALPARLGVRQLTSIDHPNNERSKKARILDCKP